WLRADGRRSRRRVLARALRSRAMSDHGGARADCPRGIGASLLWPDVPEHLLGPHPVVYSFAIPVAGVCLIATSLISAPHLWRLSAPDAAGAKMALRVRQVRTVAAVPLTIVAFKFAAMVAPRIWKLLFLLAAGYEVFAFWTLVQLLLGMVAPSFDEAVQELAALSDTKMWSVPPVACCFRPFATPQPPRREDLLIIRCLVWQFIIFVPAIAAAEMAEELPERLHNILPKLETLSLVTAMYGIFALLEATHEVLIERRSGHIQRVLVCRSAWAALLTRLAVPRGRVFSYQAEECGERVHSKPRIHQRRIRIMFNQCFFVRHCSASML
ncbi:unnamed protein product, partial [Prorocentrum cordatum]